MSRPKTGSLREFAEENGWLMLAQRVAGAAIRRTRDGLLARRLKTTGLRIGKHPRIAGLRHMRVGSDLSAGNSLWLEAVTAFAGGAVPSAADDWKRGQFKATPSTLPVQTV